MAMQTYCVKVTEKVTGTCNISNKASWVAK